MLPNRLVIGGEADVSFPSFPNSAGISVGGTSMLSLPSIGAERYSETVLSSALYGAASVTLPATGCFMRPADLLGATTN